MQRMLYLLFLRRNAPRKRNTRTGHRLSGRGALWKPPWRFWTKLFSLKMKRAKLVVVVVVGVVVVVVSLSALNGALIVL